MTDPYKILGIPRDASDDDIKSAYRTLARKYHPDNFADNETARAMAEEKMKEINEAYDSITSSRKRGSSSYGGAGRASSDSSFNRSSYITIREHINAGRLKEAEEMLDSIYSADRGAEWNFLKGCVYASKGWYFEAQKYFSTANAMDPTNPEYRNAMYNMRRGADSYNTGGYNTSDGCGCSGCDICSSLLCADCLCECCGGDLIRCC